MFTTTKKSLLNGLLLAASFSLPLQAAVTTEGLKKYYDSSVKAETALCLGTAAAIEVARFTEPADKTNPGFGKVAEQVREHMNTGIMGMHLVGKMSDIVGSALELPQSLMKNCSQSWLKTTAVAAIKPDFTLTVRVFDTAVVALNTLLFNKVNELVNNRFPGARQQTKRRLVRIASMAAARYFMYLFANIVTEVALGESSFGNVPSGKPITSIDAFNKALLASHFGQVTIDHIATECAGAALAQLIDDSQAVSVA
jgi:hypothetical protein